MSYYSFVNKIASEDNIKKLAYELWEKDGKPNGEEIDINLNIKIKDKYYFLAENELISRANFIYGYYILFGKDRGMSL